MKALAQISRILVGVLFIISGFIKANDTLGFSYKLEEYFEVFAQQFGMASFWNFWAAHAVGLAMFICIFEIMVGVALLLGAYTRLNAWLLMLMIIFFTLLTGYSAITHKVTDCGCFGDAIKLTPLQSFEKDLALLVLIIIIFAGQRYIQPLLSNKTIQSICLFVALLVTTFFTFYTYMFLPKLDFLPYKVGNDIKKLMEFPEGAEHDVYDMVFVYEKNGQQYEFNANNLPADLDTYKYIDRKDKLVKKGYEPPIHDFKLYDAAGSDYTDSLLAGSGYKLVLTQKKVEESRRGIEKDIAALAEKWQASGRPFWALTASPLSEVEPYRHEYQFAFPYYNMDATPLKSMVRSNPGLILLKGTVVVKKWSAYSFPSFETVEKYMK